jgi:hypothetical protein
MPTSSDSLADDTANTPAEIESSVESPLESSVEPSPSEQRAHFRFDKMFTVRLESPLFGESYCIARNVSAGGIFLELPDPLPLGATVRVCFLTPDSSGEVVATGEVKNHYFINFTQGGTSRAVSGMAVRFTSFENEGHHILADCLSRMRVLH